VSVIAILILGIGQKMAMIEAKLVVLHIAHFYDMQVLPNQDLDPITTITTGLKHGLSVQVKKREIK
jgi:cytochrome P450